MLRAAVLFFLVGLLAYVLGANNIAGLSLELGRILLFMFVALAVLSFVVTAVSDRKRKKQTLYYSRR